MITEALIEFLNEQTSLVGLPNVMLDFLAMDESVALQTLSQPVLLKAYIDGSSVRQTSFRLTMKGKAKNTTANAQIKIMQTLTAFSMLFQDMENFPISDKIIVENAEVTTPSILLREENGNVVYGTTVNMVYKEN